MTDVTVAPAGAAPPAAPSNEVPINPNPVHIPTPVGSQAPDAPVGDFKGSEHRPPSRREAIQAAFERAANPPARDAKTAPRAPAKPAEARPGHNNPPEETEGLDLKKRPSEQPRGERGQFAPRQDANRSQQTAQSAPDANRGQQRQAPRLPEHAPYRDPPQRMDEGAKAEWAATPEPVRASVHRMHQEFSQAYQGYRADHDTMNSIRMFHDLATKHGTTLQKALTNYVSMETKLRTDPIGGLDVIVDNLNLRTPDGQKLTLRDIAHHVLSQPPEQLQMMQTRNAQGAQNQQIGALHQELASVKNTLHQMNTAQQFGYTRSAVEQYANERPRFDELGDLIENEIKLGFDLDTAYRRAELLRPATHAAQTRTASAQTRTADKSIYGAPAAGSSNGTTRSRPEKQSRSPRDAIQNAIRRVNGSM